MEAFRTSVQAGVSPLEFWGLTPYLTKAAVDALSDGRNTQSWVQAALVRAKKMPKLESLLVQKRTPDLATKEQKMKGLFASYNAAKKERIDG